MLAVEAVEHRHARVHLDEAALGWRQSERPRPAHHGRRREPRARERRVLLREHFEEAVHLRPRQRGDQELLPPALAPEEAVAALALLRVERRVVEEVADELLLRQVQLLGRHRGRDEAAARVGERQERRAPAQPASAEQVARDPDDVGDLLGRRLDERLAQLEHAVGVPVHERGDDFARDEMETPDRVGFQAGGIVAGGTVAALQSAQKPVRARCSAATPSLSLSLSLSVSRESRESRRASAMGGIGRVRGRGNRYRYRYR